jgi:hypothetical protein
LLPLVGADDREQNLDGRERFRSKRFAQRRLVADRKSSRGARARFD